ncbi:DUF3307 domain-containing protein [Alteromonas sp. KS69]|jgi:hypothetical protein|uniref:DUF3307 domain-containing protein n=1 Tax=unclassified Alteromonas TaxID=2614992 RepID=UPI000C10D229|nr:MULTISPECIES: DUF3307 domain-containing protein [unclassified Alteromonas]MBO7921541.1 DUF3307 domain-containing protein [Alteromonas sp. K632G]PHS59462.1 MAG: hypothetical protein COB03_02680 [Alteromonas sp.]RUP81753.1 DUF3307 domain-containing protein [Alteromonas sp. KS69]|tara:strand:+ start:4802 stop:5620 length:819 start_codon:yes stop_codon:yes gene_type:complete
MEQLSIVIGLLVAHLLGDFYFQPSRWVESRNSKHLKSPALYLHSLLHGVLALTALVTLSVLTAVASKEAGLDSIDVGPLLLVAGGVLISHFIIDAVKSYAGPSTLAFAIDQAAHIGAIVILWALLTNQLGQLFKQVLMINHHHLAVLLAYMIILKPTSIFIKQLLSPWTKELDEDAKPHNSSTLVQLPIQNTLAMAGQRIGYLERLLILTFVLINQFAAIGFLLAAKSIFRFGDLTKSEDKKLTEYVLLGTLTSVVITIAVGLTTRMYMGKL